MPATHLESNHTGFFGASVCRPHRECWGLPGVLPARARDLRTAPSVLGMAGGGAGAPICPEPKVPGVCFVRRVKPAAPALLGGLSHRSRRVSGCISIHRTQTVATISRLLGSVFKYPTCAHADQSGVELSGWMITAKHTTYLDDRSLQTHNSGIIFYLDSLDHSSLFFLLQTQSETQDANILRSVE